MLLTSFIPFINCSYRHAVMVSWLLVLFVVGVVPLNCFCGGFTNLVTPIGEPNGGALTSTSFLLSQLGDEDAEEPMIPVKDSTDLAKRLRLELKDLQENQGLSMVDAQKKLLRTRLNFTTRISSVPLQTFSLNRTFVGTSSVAGRGLFALEDVSQGEVLTCYPGDALVEFSDEGESVHWDHVPVQIENALDGINQEYMLYAASDNWGIVALPELDEDPAYLGHFANDGARAPTNSAELASYVIDSNEMSNAMHQDLLDCHMVTVATRDIRRGEEIFVTYGPEYWMEQDSFCDESFESGTASVSDKQNWSNGRGFG